MNKIKYGCGDITYATCLKTEVVPNSQSSLLEEECLVQEQVNAQSLRAFVKELKTNNDGEIPTWISDFINVYEKSKIAIRKSNQKGN